MQEGENSNLYHYMERVRNTGVFQRRSEYSRPARARMYSCTRTEGDADAVKCH